MEREREREGVRGRRGVGLYYSSSNACSVIDEDTHRE